MTLPSKGYQPNFNFNELNGQADSSSNQYMAFQMQNKDMFQPSHGQQQDLIYVDNQN